MMKLDGVCGTRTLPESHLSFDLMPETEPATLHWCIGCWCPMLGHPIYSGDIQEATALL